MGFSWQLILIAHVLIALPFLVTALRQRKEPAAMLASVMTILTLPGLGVLLFWVVGSNRVSRKARRRRRRVAHLITQIGGWSGQRARVSTPDADPVLPPDLGGIERISARLADIPATGGNAVQVFADSNETYAALEAAIRAATHHVHLEYYLWQADETGRDFRDLLIARAREGIECRVLLDAVGCWRLGRRFLRPLQEAGVRVAFFLPLYPLRRRLRLHMRNHRKIAVIDGHVAFVGSQNIGDEYRGRLAKLSPWIDAHLRIHGPAALFLQQTFIEDWVFATREQLDSAAYFTAPPRPGTSIVQVVPTGPDRSQGSLEHIVFAAVAAAKHSLRLVTPYFVPDAALRMALTHASFRNVRVQVVLPTRTDAPLTLWAARSFYAELAAAGVELYEYDRGVLHSKVITVDDRWCMIGSANMDVRSFRLNFEITALLYDERVAAGVGRAVDGYCRESRRITPQLIWNRGLRAELVEGVARLFAPLL